MLARLAAHAPAPLNVVPRTRGQVPPGPVHGLCTGLPPIQATGRRKARGSSAARPRRTVPVAPSRLGSLRGATVGGQSFRRSASVVGQHPLTPRTALHRLLVFRHEEEVDEAEHAIEISAGAVKASIPLPVGGGGLFSKPITITRVPSLLRSPSSCLSLSLAFSFQFPLELSLPLASKKLLLPVALSLSMSLSLATLFALAQPGLTPSPGSAQGALEVTVGEANASIPLCLPALQGFPQALAMPRLLSISRHAVHLMPC